MNFPIVMLGPLFAVAGVAAIGLAVWVHLYQRSAKERQPVSSMRLVPDTLRVPRRRKRIQNLPLFLLRALGLVLLGAAFARPGLPGGGAEPGLGREAVVFVLDRSGSMNLRLPEGQTAWDEAVTYVQERLSRLHPQSRVRVICFPPLEPATDWVSPQAMKKQLTGLHATFEAGNPFQALQEAAEAFARFRADMPETMEIVGDLQKHGWQGVDTLTLPEELQVRIRQTGDPAVPNQSLSLQVRGQGQIRRGAMVQKGGDSALVVKDTVPGEEKPIEQKLPFSGEVQEVPYRADSQGWVTRVASIEDAQDGLVQDNSLYDSFYVPPKIVIYLLEPYPMREAFLQKTFFLQQALLPTAGDAALDSNFLPKVVPLSSASEALKNHEGGHQAVVIIPSLEATPEDLPSAVETFYQNGNGVIFFAGPEITPSHYNETWQNLLPALPRQVVPADHSMTLPYTGRNHPIWGGLGEVARQRLRKLPLKLRFRLQLSEEARILAQYGDDVPLVVSRQGEGKGILFINTSIDRSWGDWQADGALFVPAMHRLVSKVVSPLHQDLRNSNGAGIAGVPFDIKVNPAWSGEFFSVAGKTYQADDEGRIKDLLLEQPGLFDIRNSDGQVLRQVGINFPPEESQRDLLLPAILERQLLARRRVSEDGAEAAKIHIPPESGWWRWLLGALAIVWLCELLLASQNTSFPMQQKTMR
jgi:hypothetical protein